MYLDTSALIPLYLPESHSETCEAIAVGGDGFVSSELLVGEITRALLAKEKSGLINAVQRGLVMAKFEEHIAEGSLRLIPLTGGVVREATDVMRQVYPTVLLRTLDAIHLATFLSVDAGPLFTRDRRMLDAAKLLGIPVAGV